MQCLDTGFIPGILASVEKTDGTVLLVTGNNWKCLPSLESGWETVGFLESSRWQVATVISSHEFDKKIYIAPDAKWIWTNRKSWKHNRIDKTVYCRGFLGNYNAGIVVG